MCFSCLSLEFANPRAVPELGIEAYESDYTQGPACALACAAGTLYRNYFAEVSVKNSHKQFGQSEDNQVSDGEIIESL